MRRRSRSCAAAKCPSTSRAWKSCCNWRPRAAASTLPPSLAAPAAESDVIFIAVGTPPLPTGEANLCYLEAAARSIGAAMDGSRFRVVVNKSTVPVGSGNLVETLVREGIREAHPGESEARPLRRGQQSGVPARRHRHLPIRSIRTASCWAPKKSARCRCCANCISRWWRRALRRPPFCRVRPAWTRCRW